MPNGPWPPKKQVKAWSPSEAAANKVMTIPSFVIEAVNELLSLNLTGKSTVTLKQDEIVELAQQKMTQAAHIADEPIPQWVMEWLNFEPLYEQNGWKVVYEKKGYNESGSSSFHFTPKESK